MDNVQYAIEIVDRWGQPMKRFKSEIASVDRMHAKDPFRDMPRSLERLRGNLNRYKKAAEGTFRSDHLQKYNMLIGETEKKISMLESASRSASSKTNVLSGAMKMLPAIGVAGGVAIATRSVTRFGKESLQASAAFEKYAVTLRTMLGSQGAARERMTEYTDIAKKTPFELRQVVEAGNQLQAIGRYSRENVTMLGDLAAASGKPIEQVMNAYAKLSTGQKGESINMFRDLLISSEDWSKATGKGIKKNGELAATTEEMIAALPRILQKKGFFGMMDQQSKTTEGRISNLSDSLDMLKVAMGDKMKPSFDSFLMGTTGILESMTKWVAVPVSEKIAREKAGLNALVGVITDANTGEERRFGLLTQLKQEYPEFLKGVDLETIKNEELRKELEKVNAAYEKKMKYAAMKDLSESETDKLDKLKARRTRLQTVIGSAAEIERLKTVLTAKYGVSDGISGTFDEVLEKKFKKYSSVKASDPENKEADNFMGTYLDYKAQKSIQKDNGSIIDDIVDAGYRLQGLDDKIAEQERIVDIYKGSENKAKYQSLLEQSRGISVEDKSTFEQLFGKKELAKEFDDIRQKGINSFDAVGVDEWDRLASFLSGDLKYKSGPIPDPGGSGTGGSGLDIDAASATIDGGGKMVKQINVSIESLIGSNTNMFKDTDTMEDADNFLDKLSTALQLVVNDVNYSAG